MLIISQAWLVSRRSYAGSGWVGNSPIGSVAKNTSFGFGQTFVPEEDTNSLLLRKGESRLSIGFGTSLNNSGYSSSDFDPVLSFSYGLSDKWTLLDLLTLGYNLREGAREDHHLALYFGLPYGFGWSSSNVILGPGIGLMHSKKSGGWTLTQSLGFSGSLNLSKRHDHPDRWNFMALRHRWNIERQLGPRWSLGLGAESYWGKYTGVIGTYSSTPYNHIDWSVTRAQASKFLIANPYLEISRNLGDRGVLSWLILLNTEENGLFGAGTGSQLRFTTQW